MFLLTLNHKQKKKKELNEKEKNEINDWMRENGKSNMLDLIVSPDKGRLAEMRKSFSGVNNRAS